jgi:hypothetical protein
VKQDAIQTLAALVAALIEAAPGGEHALLQVAGGPLGEQLLESFLFRTNKRTSGVLATLRQEPPIDLDGCKQVFGSLLDINITSPSNVPTEAWSDLPVGYRFSVEGHELFFSCRHGDTGGRMRSMALWFRDTPPGGRFEPPLKTC